MPDMQAAFHDANGTQILTDIMVKYPLSAADPSMVLKPHQLPDLRSYYLSVPGKRFHAYHLCLRLMSAHVPGTHNQDLAYFVQHALPHFIRQFQAAANASVPVMVAFEEGVAEGQRPAEKPGDLSEFVSMLREYINDATYMLHGCCTGLDSHSIVHGEGRRSAFSA